MKKKFDDILDECLERLLVKGETLEQCLTHYPEQAVALKPLLETSLTVKRASAVQVPPAFEARARYRFRTALQGMTTKKRFFPLAWPSWATVVAVVLALVLAGGGTAAAASNSMPDEPLYPVKLATEQIQLAVTPSGIGKAELYARLADRRVTEIKNMVSKGKAEYAEKVTNRLNDDLVMIAILVKAQAGERKVALAPVPAPSPSVEMRADKNVVPRDERLAKLRMALELYRDNHLRKLRDMLKTAPESAKPALIRAILVAEVRYQQALEALSEPVGDG